MANDEINERIERLEARLDRLEHHLQVKTASAASSDGPAVEKPTVDTERDVPVTPPTEVVAPPIVRPRQPDTAPYSLSATRSPGGADPGTVPPRVAIAKPRTRSDDAPGRSVELMIGGKWMGWIGAIVVVIGAGFIIKLGYDAGWWSMMSAGMRCLLVAGFGLLLLAGGEVMLRRVGRFASTGLYGAGLGVLYLNAFATFRFFDLLSENGSFVLMAIVAVIGFVITLRTRFLTIGVLSLVGGYLAPILLRGQFERDLALVGFLTFLFAIALALSAIRRLTFRPMRYIALAFQMLLGGWWIISRGPDHWTWAVFFASVWWAMVMAESLLAALRRQSALGNVFATLVATAAYVSAGCWILYEMRPSTGPDWLGAFTLLVGVLCAAAAFQFGPGLDGLRGPLRTAIEKFAVALWAQFGVLIVVAIALQFEDAGRAVGWFGMAVGVVEIGRRLPSRGVDVFGLVVWVLAAIYLTLLGLWFAVTTSSSPLVNVLWEWPSVRVDGYAVLAVIAIMATIAMALRLRGHGEHPWRIPPVLLTIAAAAGWMALCFSRTEGLATTTGWLLGAALLVLTHRIGRRQGFAAIALLVLTAALTRWLLIDALEWRFGSQWRTSVLPLFINGRMGLALGIAACTWWAGYLVGRRETRPGPQAGAVAVDPSPGPLAPVRRWLAETAIIVAAVLVMLGLTFELDLLVERMSQGRVERLTTSSTLLRALLLTGLWALGGMAMMFVGRWRERAAFAVSGWIILGGAAVTWLSYDTIGWRLTHPPAPLLLVLNLQFGVGFLLAALLAVAARLVRQSVTALGIEEPGRAASMCVGLVALVGLWLGSLEIDRGFAGQAMARQAGWSVYWSLYGMVLIVIGFWRRSGVTRYAGLALLGITVLKVLLIDLATVEQIWRVVSFIASGLLMVGTSALYFKLSPRLLDSLHGKSSRDAERDLDN